MCVQPMKAIAAVALTSHLTANQVATAGFTTSAIIFILSATQLLTPIYRLCPLPLIRGIQLGTGLSLINKGMKSVLSSGDFSASRVGVAGLKFWTDNWLIALLAFCGVLIMYPRKRLNFTAIVLTLYCLVVALVTVYGFGAGFAGGVGPGFPGAFLWESVTGEDFRIGFLNAGLGQLPLTLLNSVFATSKLADDLFPERPRPVASIGAVGVFVGLMNLSGVWFGSLPWCMGSGGLAGQYRFGARSHYSVIFLGTVKILLGLLFGKALLPVIQAFPASIMGVMLIVSGIELASSMRNLTVSEPDNGGKVKESSSHAFLVAFVGGSVVAASGNDGIGFLVGGVAAFILWCHEVREEEEERRESGGEVRGLSGVVWERVVGHVRECFGRRDRGVEGKEGGAAVCS
ncbi:hypothetical protein HDU98_001145 [Podochytrium sp. JEL0797]|nr:hypothetical protein HDU98_001145 [Podochytrium sp. JEL0797]